MAIHLPNPLHPINKLLGIGTRAPSAQQLWINNGGPQGQTMIAAAVGAAESSCDNHADNNVCCACWLQVNYGVHTPESLHISKPPKGKSFRDAIKSDADYCTKAAVAIYKAQGWGGWQTYTEGTYKDHLGKDCEVKNAYSASFAQTVPGQETLGGAASVSDNPLSVLKDIANFFYLLTQASTWLRVGKVALGVLVILIVTALLIKG